ncbi:MAG: hypothetical protein QXU54_02545 [Candidatus Micrarchaeia archaeon]
MARVRNSLNISKNDFVRLHGKNSEVLATISAHPNAENFFVARKLSNRMFYLLLKMTAVKRIMVSERLGLSLPHNCLQAIKKTGVQVILVRGARRGRPKKYGVKIARVAGSKSLSRASKRSGIPLRTLYYHREKMRAKNARELKTRYRFL